MFLKKVSSLFLISCVCLFTGFAQNFAEVFNQKALNGKNGFSVKGINNGDRLGFEVALIGDINGDGLEDIGIEAQDAKPNGLELAGTAYVIFGSRTPFSATFDLTTLNGTNGFKVEGIVEDERRGKSIGKLGDINGDGIDDLALGTEKNEAMIIYGKKSVFPASFTISDINGINGFVLKMTNSNNISEIKGNSDFNGDGIKDLVMGSYSYPGNAYILFGQKGNFPAVVTETWFDGTKGFRLSGVAGHYPFMFVDFAGDVNNDGYDDVLVGLWLNSGTTAQKSYVYFGKAGTSAPLVDVQTVNGTTGFAINNNTADAVKFLAWVGPLGDINNDGFDDFYSQENVIYGAPTFSAVVDLVASPNASKGFRIPKLSKSAAPIGDFNRDGINDFIFTGYSECWVVYGSSAGFSTSLDVTLLDETKGFKIANLNQSNTGRLVAGDGDINGDGLSDFIVGSEFDEKNGVAYIVFGGDHFAKPFTSGYPKAVSIGYTGFTLQVNAQEKGKAHYSVLEGNQYDITNTADILNGAAAFVHGYIEITQAGANRTKVITGLPVGGKYDVYIYFEDELGNKGKIYKLDDVTLLTDTQAPVMTCPQNASLDCSGLPDYSMLVTVTDNAGTKPVLTQWPAAGSIIYTDVDVTLTAKDASGNTSSCTFKASVLKTVLCPANQQLALGSALPDYAATAQATGFCRDTPKIVQTPEAGTPVTNNLTVTITAEDVNATVSCSFIINPVATSIEATSAGDMDFVVYPNPAKDILSVKDRYYARYELIDNRGSLILQGQSTSEINISGIQNGMYMILFYNSEGKQIGMKKIIKN